jgi:hypothetical protein
MDFIRQINLIDSHFKSEWANYKFTSTIRESRDQFYPPFIRVKIPKASNTKKSNKLSLSIFDLSDTPKSIDYIIPGSWATSLIYLKHVWVNNVTYNVGLTWYVLQTKVKTPIPQLPSNQCLIDDPWFDETFCAICYSKVIREPAIRGIDEENENMASSPISPEYEKYTKMLKLGIPILAVVQRCQIDGLDPEILKRQASQKHNHKYTSMPPPPPPPSFLKGSMNSSQSSIKLPFSANDLLKSRERLGTSSSAKIREIKPLNIRKRDPRVPSLNMILQSRNQLKTTNKPSDYHEKLPSLPSIPSILSIPQTDDQSNN